MFQFNICEVEPDDYEAVLAILNYEITNKTSNFSYTPLSLDEMSKEIESKKELGFPFLVAKREGIVLGFGTYGKFRPREGYKQTIEHSIYVSEEAQGKKVGKALFQELRVDAATQGYKSMIAVIGDENDGSIHFHTKLGFSFCGRIPGVANKFNRDLNVVIMQLFL
ncbi:GNAT family N-acetyltransferase [Parvicella tangerina]|uniref:L-methionine sulfoximine/L-methionine sulfone acetyltransferase n=1 Tax=Parvicella tangerina TaxID=2829795 RepID=A0A916JN63_9FLAO|nr:GNAT family N-acetyltransferase [Parvicella tangerina]CAG5083341.1 L-methionine sulfoximine/L-methionine sulfone acetyltransferase [Parvicella tangerina]